MSEVDMCVNKLSDEKTMDNEYNKKLRNLCQILYGLDLPTETVKAEGEGEVELFRSLIHLWFYDISAIEDIYHILGKSGLCFLHNIRIYLSLTVSPKFVLHKHLGKQKQNVHFDASIYKKNQIDECKQKFMAIPISLNLDEFGHANLLFISLHEINATGKIIVKTEYFEPHGSQYNNNETKTSIIKNGIQSLVNMLFSDETKYIVEPIVPPVDHCPNIRGLQSLVNNSYFEGSCAIFTILYAILKLLNPEYEQRRITEHIYEILQKNDNPVFIMKLIINTLMALLNIEKRGDDYYIINDGDKRKILENVKGKDDQDAYGNKYDYSTKGEIAIDFRPGDSYKTYVGKINDLGQMVTGKLTFKNGDIYEGDFRNGKRTGKGIFYWKDGNVYKGDFVNGKRSGKGILRFVDGYVYEGEFLDGKRSGKGVFRFVNGDTYEGDFVNDEMTGKGILHFSDGDVYVGDFIDGDRTGKGILRFANGDVYEGDFIDDERTGKGILRFANGDVYEGDFVDDERIGKGILRFANGDVYEGDFVDDEMTGEGIFRVPKKTIKKKHKKTIKKVRRRKIRVKTFRKLRKNKLLKK